jgi:hypothetical protein
VQPAQPNTPLRWQRQAQRLASVTHQPNHTMQPLRPIDYAFAAAFGITLGCLLAAFI